MLKIIKKLGTIISVVLCACVFILIVGAAEKVNPILERGIGQYKHENYDEALLSLKKAREESPQSTLAAYYLGLTLKQTQNYKGAVPHLRDAVTFSPKIKGALIELIDCLYQLDELEEAKKWIEEAEKEGLRPAQIAFLKGLILLKDGDSQGAISAFEKAKELDKSMAQTSNYQIGIARLKSRAFGDAKLAFKEVIAQDPSSTAASLANEYISAITKAEEATKPLRLSFGAAWQYDDNVILKPSDTSLATDVTDKADSREVFTGKAELNHRFSDLVGISGQYLLYYAKQNDLGFYDLVSNTFAGQPSLYFKNGFLTFPFGYNHVLVNDKAYLSSPFASGVYNFMLGSSSMGQVSVKYQHRDYLWTPSTTDEDRDGNELGAGAGWYLFYAKNRGFLNIRYALNKDWTEGNNWTYLGNRATATVLVPVLDKLNFTVSGDMYLQDFENTHTVYIVRRKDTVWTISALLAYKFYKDSEIQLQYTHILDDSNISIYGYTRNIYSAGVEIKF